MILENTAIANFVDPFMIKVVLIFVIAAICAYFAGYVVFIIFLIDPNVAEVYRSEWKSA